MVAGLWTLVPLGTSILHAQTAKSAESTREAQADAALDSNPRSRSAPLGQARLLDLYRTHCIDCHDANGGGSSARDLVAHAPDFTDPRWHQRHGDTEIKRVIWEGKKPMPAMKGKLALSDVERLVVLVRGFRGGRLVVSEDAESAERSDDRSENSERPESSPVAPTTDRPMAEESLPFDASRPAVNDKMAAMRTTFTKYCIRCHGSGGDGSPIRSTLPSIPDFRSRPWHERKSDGALSFSILEGKGTGMPSFADKLESTRVRDLVEYLRSLAGMRIASRNEVSVDFDQRFERLMSDMETLKRDYYSLAPRGMPSNSD
jgi:mono/diheme cytochrome c family protein